MCNPLPLFAEQVGVVGSCNPEVRASSEREKALRGDFFFSSSTEAHHRQYVLQGHELRAPVALAHLLLRPPLAVACGLLARLLYVRPFAVSRIKLRRVPSHARTPPTHSPPCIHLQILVYAPRAPAPSTATPRHNLQTSFPI